MEFNIWDKQIPFEDGNIQNRENANMNRITFFPAESDDKTDLVVIFPGGGYGYRTYDYEGVDIAKRLNEYGISAAVVDYRVAPYHYPCELLDAQRAIKVLRSKADELNINPDRVFTLGFSAGGHLCAMTATFPDICDIYGDEIDKQSAKPTGALLCYAVISCDKDKWHRGTFTNLLGEEQLANKEEFSLEKRVNKETCPCFVWCCAYDGAVPKANSLEFAKALWANDILCELHIFPEGDHGGGLRDNNKCSRSWSHLAIDWIKRFGLSDMD